MFFFPDFPVHGDHPKKNIGEFRGDGDSTISLSIQIVHIWMENIDETS